MSWSQAGSYGDNWGRLDVLQQERTTTNSALVYFRTTSAVHSAPLVELPPMSIYLLCSGGPNYSLQLVAIESIG